MSGMIEVKGLSCGYGGRPVIEEMELRVDRGRLVGILGPNGSGKSTLIRAIAGLLRPMGGKVVVEGRNIHDIRARERARLLATVSQRISFDFPFTCLEAVVMGRYARSHTLRGYSREDWEAAEEAICRVGLQGKIHHPADQLSGGEMQLLALARGICQETPFLLLDEATANLDLARKVEVFELLSALAMEGKGIISVIHDINLAALYCHRLVIMKRGRIIADGGPADVIRPHLLLDVFGAEVVVGDHPTLPLPQVHLLPARKCAKGADASGDS